MQLAFPFVAAPIDADSIPPAVAALSRHLAAVTNLRELVRGEAKRDAVWRATRLSEICHRHREAVVVAFTSFEATAQAIFFGLKDRAGVALLTGHGAVGGGGVLARTDILNALATTASRERRLDVRLVIATDVLSEGVNLQRASVIVHLDDPWTPAAITQRVGRAARIGSTHQSVFVYRFAPPRSAQALLDMSQVHRTKRAAALVALAPGSAAEMLLRTVRQWKLPVRSPSARVVAACAASRNGFLATLHDRVHTRVLGSARYSPLPIATNDPTTLARLAASVREVERAPPRADEIRTVSRAIDRWIRRQRVRARTGDSRNPSTARRRVICGIDRILDRATASELRVVAARASRLRAALASLRGTGVEALLSALAGHQQFDRRWFDEVERELLAIQQPPDRSEAESEIGAILVLRKSDHSDPAS